MKRDVIMSSAVAAVALIVWAASGTTAYGATLELSPKTLDAQVGKDAVVGVFFKPEGGAAYTVKAALMYPPEAFSVQAFILDERWMRLNKPEYDFIDNTTGLAAKTGGYPGGLSTTSDTFFGTLTLRAKKAGEFTLAAKTADSFALGVVGQNILTVGAATALIKVKEAAPAAPTSETPPAETLTPAPAKLLPDFLEVETAPATSSEKTPEELAAAVGATDEVSSKRNIWLILLAAAIILGVGYFSFKEFRKETP